MIPALTSRQLEDILSRDRALSFCGVFPYDRIPQRVQRYPCSFVVNTDDSKKPGEHWISLYFDGKRECQYFCPLGTEPYGRLFDFAKHNSDETYFNRTTLQHPLSSACGYYCVYHLVHASRGFALDDIVNEFSSHALRKNDIRAFDFVSGYTT